MKKTLFTALAFASFFDSNAMDVVAEFNCQTIPPFKLCQLNNGKLTHGTLGFSLTCSELFLGAGSNTNGIIPINDLEINGNMPSDEIKDALIKAFNCIVTVTVH
ncbi:MAG: hypothetical protein LBF44_02080 [Holosporaceae bacterium]|jgi:hypothetical protein|nr:hypothetical protein [Holosporaceae bacterium]